MNPSIPDWQGVIHRLEKLERENRRLKAFGLTALLGAAALLIMGQAAPQKTVQANAFVLNDANGKARAFLGLTPDGPALGFYDDAGRLRTSLDAAAHKPGLRLFDEAGQTRASLATGAEGPALDLHDGAGKLRASLTESLAQPRLAMFGFGKQGAELTVDADTSQLLISDPDGFEASVGTTDLGAPRTGQTHRTSAASVVLFDKDKNVIWKAP